MIQLKNLSLNRGTKNLLKDVNLTLHAGEKVGLVGRNGVGKSSLFSLLLNESSPDQGDCSISKEWRVATVAQHLPKGEWKATDFVVSGDLRLAAARQKLDELESVTAPSSNEHGEALAHAYHDWQEAGAYEAESTAQTLLLGLGFLQADFHARVDSFSGGWQMRLQLARTLMSPSDLLLLDEPTNHLDLDALVWLEDWLSRYSGNLIIISHDRDFLDSMVDVIVHLENTTLTRYTGNYSSFEMQRATRLALSAAAYDSQQQKISHLTQFISRFKAKASKAKQAQSRIKALERMEKLAPVLSDAEFSFEFKPVGALPNPMLVLAHADLGYRSESNEEEAEPSTEIANDRDSPRSSPQDAKIILPNVKLSIRPGMRLGILGANGQGKSTLVKTLAGALPTLTGERREGKGLSIGYFAQQELDILETENSPLQHIITLSKRVSPNAREQELRNYLGLFQFRGDDVNRPVASMSGGEKARLVLMLITWQKPNILILDEPTNHLDLVTRMALSMAINSFDGAVILVSHDRSLLRTVCEDFWLVANGKITPFTGDLNDYQTYLLAQAKSRQKGGVAALPSDFLISNETTDFSSEQIAVPSAKNPSSKEETNSNKNNNKTTSGSVGKGATPKLNPQKLKAEAASLEKKISELSEQKNKLEALLASIEDYQKIQKMGQELAQILQSLSTLENEWLSVLEQLEGVA